MASESPLVKKLGIKGGDKVLLMNAPGGLLPVLSALPPGASLETGGDGPFDFMLMFVSTSNDVEASVPGALRRLRPGGRLWFAYPKKSSTVKTDISRDTGWDALSKADFRPVSLVAFDDTWSALRFRPRAEVKG